MRKARVLALVLLATQVSAEPVTLTPQQTREAAFQLLRSGQALESLDLIDALVERDDKDAYALILRAQALQALGQHDKARVAAKSAFKLADTDAARFGAAMVTAQALTDLGNPTMAQLWLRRAGEEAPDDRSKLAAREEFGYVRSRNPLILRFDFSAAPSSNVNNGSRNSSFMFTGLPSLPPEILPITGEAQALSGGTLTFGFGATYRLPPTATTMTELTFTALQRVAWLSSSAREIAPEARAGDYNFATVEVGLSRKIRPEGAKVIYDLGVTVGHNWSGGEDLSNYLRFEAQADRALGKDLSGFIAASAEHQQRLDVASRSADVLGLTLGLNRLTANQDRLQFRVSGRWTLTDNPGIRSNAISARLSWDKGKPVAGIGLSAGLLAEAKDYPDSPFNASGRLDTKIGVDLSLNFEKIEYLGFTPTLNVQASRTDSNVGLFDNNDVGVSVGIRSSF